MITELRLQQECFMYFNNAYPHLRGLFFRIKNENTNRISGAIGKATGIIPGVADSCLLTPTKGACFIELKIGKGVQSPAQKEWERLITSNGYEYFIVSTLNGFMGLCQELLD